LVKLLISFGGRCGAKTYEVYVYLHVEVYASMHKERKNYILNSISFTQSVVSFTA